MKRTIITIFALTVLLAGCAQTQRSPSDHPAWDENVPLEDGDSDAPSLSDKLSHILSDEDSNYHFRKVKWGFSQERVELSEAGNTVFERKENAIVYKTKLNGVYCRLIYTFKDNKLRTAGYMTITPIPSADNLIKEAVDKHGVPETDQKYCDGLQEMVWKAHDTVIFANLYPTVEKRTSTSYRYSRRGLLRDLVRNQLPDQEAGKIIYWDGTYAHIDPAFFTDLHEVNLPLSELSFYEKRLLGIILRTGRMQIPGVGTIPQ